VDRSEAVVAVAQALTQELPMKWVSSRKLLQPEALEVEAQVRVATRLQ
jgi:hypothetical protein